MLFLTWASMQFPFLPSSCPLLPTSFLGNVAPPVTSGKSRTLPFSPLAIVVVPEVREEINKTHWPE